MMKNKKILWMLKLTVGLVLLYFIYRNVYRHERFIDAFEDATWVNLLIALILLVPNYGIQFLKWRYILKRALEDVPDSQVLKSLLFGSTLGFITPGNLGELARGLYFGNQSRLLITGLNIIDKFAGMIVFISFGLIAMNRFIIAAGDWSKFMSIVLTSISCVLIILIWFLALSPEIVSRLCMQIPVKKNWQKKFFKLLSALNFFDRQSSFHVLLLNIAWFLVILLQYHVLVLAFTQVSFLQTFWAVSATLLTKIALPISVGDLGIREGAAVFYYSLLGIKKTVAFNASVLIFFINFMIPALVGSYFVFKLAWRSPKNDNT